MTVLDVNLLILCHCACYVSCCLDPAVTFVAGVDYL